MKNHLLLLTEEGVFDYHFGDSCCHRGISDDWMDYFRCRCYLQVERTCVGRPPQVSDHGFYGSVGGFHNLQFGCSAGDLLDSHVGRGVASMCSDLSCCGSCCFDGGDLLACSYRAGGDDDVGHGDADDLKEEEGVAFVDLTVEASCSYHLSGCCSRFSNFCSLADLEEPALASLVLF